MFKVISSFIRVLAIALEGDAIYKNLDKAYKMSNIEFLKAVPQLIIDRIGGFKRTKKPTIGWEEAENAIELLEKIKNPVNELLTNFDKEKLRKTMVFFEKEIMPAQKKYWNASKGRFI